MKILHLTLKKKWFDLIRSGEKKEEYREIKKYWIDRLAEYSMIEYSGTIAEGLIDNVTVFEYKHFDIIRFTNGYGKNAPTFDIECKSISIGTGKPEWGGEGQTFIISLGKIISK
jgi:hypothetical protein